MDSGFQGLVGLTIVSTSEDAAVLELEAGDEHLNRHGTVHGGAIATLIDTAMGAAIAREGEAPVTIEMKVTYLEPAPPGVLRGAASVRRRGKRITIAEVEVTDAAEEVVAHGIGTFTTI